MHSKKSIRKNAYSKKKSNFFSKKYQSKIYLPAMGEGAALEQTGAIMSGSLLRQHGWRYQQSHKIDPLRVGDGFSYEP